MSKRTTIYITLLTMISMLWLSGCSYNPYNSPNPPKRPPKPPVKLGCGNYYLAKSNKLPLLKVKFDDNTMFDSHNLDGRVTVLYFGTGDNTTDQPLVTDLYSNLQQINTLESSLWVFGATGSTAPQAQSKNSTLYWQNHPGNIAAELGISQLPAVVMIDSENKEIRWIAQGNCPNMVPSLLSAIANLLQEQHNPTTWREVLTISASTIVTLAAAVGIFLFATINNGL